LCSVRFVWALANKSSPGRPPRSVVYERLQTQIVELRERFGGLPSPVEAQDIWRGIWLEEAHHSTGQVSAWIERTRELTRCDPVALPEVLAALHVRFEQIHPFLDGNGRAGRLALNLLLVRLGYPPAIIYKRDRGRYLTALRRADEHDFGALGELLARAVLDSLYRFIVPAVAARHGSCRFRPSRRRRSPRMRSGWRQRWVG